nr:aminopeptidase [Akkermansia muciniphila]
MFTAPVIDSANGHISFNTPSLFQGIPFDNIRLTLKNGLVVHAEAGDKTGSSTPFLTQTPARGGWGIRLRRQSGHHTPHAQHPV